MAHPALKRIEKKGQQLLFAAARLLFTSSRTPAPVWGTSPVRVLYLRYDRIGDMIMATPLIRAIAGSHPTISVDVLASPANAPVLEGNPHVREVLTFNRRRKADFPRVLRLLRSRHYDVVIDGMVMTPSVTMMLLMRATGARHRIGIGGRKNDFVYTLPVPPAPASAHLIEQSRKTALPFGIDLDRTSWQPELFMRPEELARANARWGDDRRPRILLNVSAVTPDRHWPPDRYATLLSDLRALRPGARVLLISAPGDRGIATLIASQAAGEVADTPGIRDAFALVATADAVFTPDTSISHAAGALGVPLAVMIPAGSLYGPYGASHVRIESPGRTLEELPVAQAVQGLRDLLKLAGV